MKNPLLFFFVVVCHLNLSNAQFQQCYTPDQRPGSCINVNQCPSILAILSTQDISDADRTYLQRSQCGYFGYVAVCCPHESNATQSPTVGLQISDLPQPGTCGSQVLLPYPWMALIEFTKTYEKGFRCGGVLINKDYVLTAAHCVSGKDILASQWTLSGVRLGEWDLSSAKDCRNGYCTDPVLDIPVVERIVHENYASGSNARENDIALLRLGRSVQFTNFVKPICLPVSSEILDRNYDGVSMIVSGWGQTENKPYSAIKQKLRINGVPLSQCNGVYRNRNIQLSRNHLCAGGVKGKDACHGDSGGPLMAWDKVSDPQKPHFYLAGLVSFGPKSCGLENWPGVYTRIDRYTNWILSHMRP